MTQSFILQTEGYLLGEDFVGFIYPKSTLSINNLNIYSNQTSEVEYKATDSIIITNSTFETGSNVTFIIVN